MFDQFDIRMKTYDEETAGYVKELPLEVDFNEPGNVVRKFSTEGAVRLGQPVDTEDFPTGTWFTYVDGSCYVRQVGADSFCRIEGESMTEHTPGPWQWYWRTLDREEGVSEADCGVFWEEREGMAISVCRAPRYEKQKQWEANACLIAAAPELLEAAKIAVLNFKRADASGNFLGDDEHESWTALNNAIAKAEGERG